MEVDKYEVKFFAVGDKTKGGDAIFIRLIDYAGNTTIILIDGGYQETGNSIIKYLNDLGLNTIDLMINTHPDLDHISGLITIMKSDIHVKKLIMNIPWRDSNITADFFEDNRITDNSVNKRLTQNFKKAYELEQLALNPINNCTIVHPVPGNSYFDCFYILGPAKPHYRDCLLKSDKTPTTLDDSKPQKQHFSLGF